MAIQPISPTWRNPQWVLAILAILWITGFTTQYWFAHNQDSCLEASAWVSSCHMYSICSSDWSERHHQWRIWSRGTGVGFRGHWLKNFRCPPGISICWGNSLKRSREISTTGKWTYHITFWYCIFGLCRLCSLQWLLVTSWHHFLLI